jgi:hypothetical protein
LLVTLQTPGHVFGVDPVTTITAESPLHIFSIPEKCSVGFGLTITVAAADAVQELALVTVTVYVAEVWGATVITDVAAPLDHR